MCIDAKIDPAVVGSHIGFLKECISRYLEGPREHLASFGKLIIFGSINFTGIPFTSETKESVEILIIIFKLYNLCNFLSSNEQYNSSIVFSC